MLYHKNKNLIKHRKRIIFSFYVVIISIIFIRYFNLQIIQFEKYTTKAGNNSIRKIVLNAPRGIIFDRWNKPLVDNQLIYGINIIPKDFDIDNFNYELFYKTINISKETIKSIILPHKKSNLQFQPILIKRKIDFKIKSILEENKIDLSGLYFSTFPARKYSQKCNLTHVLGYLRKVNPSNNIIGYSGIENIYENYLKGKDGVEYHLVDRFGTDQGLFDLSKNYNPIQGDSLILTIDRDIQEFVEDLVKDYKGAIILMDPKSGEIYSLVSFPDYELDSFTGPIPKATWDELVDNPDKPFNNRTMQNAYPPGSIFKLILSMIALEHNIIDESWKINCNGVYDFHDTKFHCWKEGGHGSVNLSQSIQKSCNIFFYNLIQKIDLDFWYTEVTKFGFGQLTGIDLPSENKGLIPNKKYMNMTYKDRGGWSKGHLLNLSIGQGETLTTPLQIINFINIIANEGYCYKPHLNKLNKKEKTFSLYNTKVYKKIKHAMSNAVYKNEGTAYNARILNKKVNIYGKTGTVQLCSDCDIKPHAWFTGILEIKGGQMFTICVLIENGGKGSNLSTKIARDIFDFIIKYNV